MLNARPERLMLEARRVESGDGFLERGSEPARGSEPGSAISSPSDVRGFRGKW